MHKKHKNVKSVSERLMPIFMALPQKVLFKRYLQPTPPTMSTSCDPQWAMALSVISTSMENKVSWEDRDMRVWDRCTSIMSCRVSEATMAKMTKPQKKTVTSKFPIITNSVSEISTRCYGDYLKRETQILCRALSWTQHLMSCFLQGQCMCTPTHAHEHKQTHTHRTVLKSLAMKSKD